MLPHSLTTAHTELTALLDEAVELYQQSQRYVNAVQIIRAIERFVHEIKLVPEWMSELERRASLVEVSLGPSSDYGARRRRALKSCAVVPSDFCRATLARDRLNDANTVQPRSLAEVQLIRGDIEAIIESAKLTPLAVKAYEGWLASCQHIQREAERLEIDGCWFLYHVYLSAEPERSKRSEAARAMLGGVFGGASLESIRAAAASIIAWISEHSLPITAATDPSPPQAQDCGDGESPASAASAIEPDPPQAQGARRDSRAKSPKRSWTQSDLNEAIRAYKAARASTYSDLVAGVKRGDPGARKDARRLFGRNAIARALAVKSAAMVTSSPDWQAIAAELKLSRMPSRGGTMKLARIGTEIALEEQAAGASMSVVDEVVRRETIQIIQASMPTDVADATVEKLLCGENTDDQARQLVVAYLDQRREERAHRIRRDP